MITLQITIAEIPQGGVGVNVQTNGADMTTATDEEGATWVGLCQAINGYMHSVGATNFDCLRQKGPRQ